VIKIDDSDLRRLEKDLHKLSHRALPHAIRGTHRAKGFATMNEARSKIDKEFILRNAWTKRSVQVEMGKDQTTVGSIADYMEDQEFGGSKKKRGKVGVAIPTSFASGASLKAQPRMKKPRRKNMLKNITFSKARRKTGGKGAEILGLIRAAVETGQRTFYWDTGRQQKGIFRVLGGRLLKSGRVKGAKLRMVYDLSETSVRIPRSPWLLPSTNKVQKRTEEIYAEQLERQIKINQLFKNKGR